MTNTFASEKPAQASRPSRGCGSHGCGPRAHGGRFNGPLAEHFGWHRYPVNIEETADAFVLNLYAAGLNKTGIQVSAQGDVLTIRYQAPAADDSARNFTRHEWPQRGFEREFAFNGKVQINAITAAYSDGVLTIRLPKAASAMQAAHSVPVR